MMPMTPHITPTKVLLIPDSRAASEVKGGDVRRFRIARLHFGGAAQGAQKPFEHLTRVYD